MAKTLICFFRNGLKTSGMPVSTAAIENGGLETVASSAEITACVNAENNEE